MLDSLMDRDGGVDNCWLDDFALNDRLYLFVDVVVRVFAGYGRAFNTSALDWKNLAGGPELGFLLDVSTFTDSIHRKDQIK